MIDWTKFLPNARHVATLPRLKPRTAICRLNVVQIGFRQFLWLRKQMAFAPHEWKPVICAVAAFRNIQFFPASKLKDLLMLLSPNPQVAGPHGFAVCATSSRRFSFWYSSKSRGCDHGIWPEASFKSPTPRSFDNLSNSLPGRTKTIFGQGTLIASPPAYRISNSFTPEV